MTKQTLSSLRFNKDNQTIKDTDLLSDTIKISLENIFNSNNNKITQNPTIPIVQALFDSDILSVDDECFDTDMLIRNIYSYKVFNHYDYLLNVYKHLKNNSFNKENPFLSTNFNNFIFIEDKSLFVSFNEEFFVYKLVFGKDRIIKIKAYQVSDLDSSLEHTKAFLSLEFFPLRADAPIDNISNVNKLLMLLNHFNCLI